MLLTEILDKPFEYTIMPPEYGDWTAHFKDAGGNLVIVTAAFYPGAEAYILEFKRKGDFKMTNDSPTDSNQAVRIMTTVIAIIKDILNRVKSDEKYPPNFLVYSVEKTETSRAALYQRYMGRLASTFGYEEIKDVDKVDHPHLRSWWKNKLRISGENHSYVLLGKKT